MKAYTDHCNIKMPIKITLIVFISIVFQKMLTTVLPKLRQQKTDVSNFTEILTIQHCPNKSKEV